MSPFSYLMIFSGTVLMAVLVFSVLFQNHKRKTGRPPEPQTMIIWAALCLFGVLGFVTIVQIADHYHISPEERMRQLGIG